MKYHVILTDEANAYQKALRLIAELYEHPHTGTGHPEQLKGHPDGRWSEGSPASIAWSTRFMMIKYLFSFWLPTATMATNSLSSLFVIVGGRRGIKRSLGQFLIG